MRSRKARVALLIALSGGMLFASTCDAVTQTVFLALQIADVWV
jgi:hypothetical protein